MLSPGNSEAGSALAGAVSQTLAVTSFAGAVPLIRIGQLSPEPCWLQPLRVRLADLSQAAQRWQGDVPAIQSDLLAPFAAYAGALAPLLQQSGSRIAVLERIEMLQGLAAAGAARMARAQGAFSEHLAAMRRAQAGLEEPLRGAWHGLAAQEAGMAALAAKVAALQAHVDSWQSPVEEALLDPRQGHVQTMVTISLPLSGPEGRETPFLSLVSELGSAGEIGRGPGRDAAMRFLDDIARLRARLSPAAQAAALATSVTRTVDSADRAVSGRADRFPEILRMWRTETDTLAALGTALRAGAEPSAMPALGGLRVAAADWQALAALARSCALFPAVRARQGRPVALAAHAPVAAMTA
ncbi:hypothetical protein [Mangrovicoccus sp. HB161399]|uniref:hypothetical protein n=1 Tax=Mangrovicoccus sp. HB161399 TaxID=2720392 RepID=UPI0015583105|nr:hypothetical protein [Mangrovicoccus sp. HB161399]